MIKDGAPAAPNVTIPVTIPIQPPMKIIGQIDYALAGTIVTSTGVASGNVAIRTIMDNLPINLILWIVETATSPLEASQNERIIRTVFPSMLRMAILKIVFSGPGYAIAEITKSSYRAGTQIQGKRCYIIRGNPELLEERLEEDIPVTVPKRRRVPYTISE